MIEEKNRNFSKIPPERGRFKHGKSTCLAAGKSNERQGSRKDSSWIVKDKSDFVI
jgi:hypothetical protein